ncbi:uncharacterized protein BX663DRAFT_498691 [Cokeromyces recurvatus]|uniref:uncharacterized protein n=1 Tax=Cokeromyces recurvatus TaxID=90255 RepID=UPI002220B4B9|nr:uncharacterized protein BX663DRAFT_498691 [Cokeromyces recurvatus]KAI7906075.1 hypothetical protein BX663DRAFT_498691 [Cokeromyces recurvatus]
MKLFSIIGQFLLLWGFLYVIVFTLQIITTRKKTERTRRKNDNSLLPTSFSLIDQRNTSTLLERDHWSIKLFQIKYTTQRLNKLFNYLTTIAPTFWKIWFTVGVVVAAFLMIAGFFIILFAAIKIISSLAGHLFSSSNSSHYVKRSFENTARTINNDDQVFLPMIPGITLPMSHIGYYLLALTICGLYHEAGHAIASYSQGIPIQNSGIFVLYLYPGAFVNIPDQPLQNLQPWKQLKIICAGVWHNLVLYLFTFLSLAGGLKILLLLIGWQSLENTGGVSVVHVRANSPLAPHLPPSTIIYQLDDYPLVNTIKDWNYYLFERDGQHELQQGFCAAKPIDEKDNSCCQINDTYPFGQSLNASISCFNLFPSTGKKDDRMCLQTLQVLASVNPARCYKDIDCEENDMICVTPYTPSVAGQVVRVYAQFPSWVKETDNEKVFVFEGELIDIWESVKVSILTPRFWFLPTSLPHILELLLQ